MVNDAVWVLAGVLTTLNLGLWIFTSLNLKKTGKMLDKVQTAINVNESKIETNKTLLDEMKAIVLNEE